MNDFVIKVLKNSYSLGILIVVTELVINNVLLTTLLPHISGVILAFVAGFIYAALHKARMPFKERLKTLTSYLAVAGLAALLVVSTQNSGEIMPVIAIAIVVGTFLLYAVAMHFALGIGSSGYMSAYERKLTSPASDGQQDILKPIPNAAAFGNRYPKTTLMLALIGCLVMFAGLSYALFDPLTESRDRIFVALLTFGIGAMIVGSLYILLGKRIVAVFIGILVVTGIDIGLYISFAHKPPPAEGMDALMVSQQTIALKCVEKNANLLGHLRGWRRGEPNTGFAICYRESSWKFPLSGWDYNKIEDVDVSDKTFMFSARNRLNDRIVCSEKGCDLIRASGETTVLSTTTIVSRIVSTVSLHATIPVSGSVRTGSIVEIAQITLTNSGTAPIDLRALWYKKSGTASDNAIKMIHVDEGESTFGTSYSQDLYLAQKGLLYIDQPHMFLLQPGQSRTYSFKIELSDEARQEQGKTIGLDFVGFADSKVNGMPVIGAIYTIAQ